MKNITDCNLLIGYVWADSFRATAAAVVNSTNKITGDKICKKIAKRYYNNRHNLNFDMISDKIENIFNKIKNNFTIIADSGDNPTAGGVGDRADVLKYVIDNDFEKVLFAGIVSPLTYIKLLKNKFTKIVLGGELGHAGEKIKLIPSSVRFKNKCVIITYKQITIVITKYRRPFHYLSDFIRLHLNIGDYKLLIVKSGYLSPDLRNLSNQSFMILSNGAANQNLRQIENKKRKKPIFPFQNFNKFIPKVSDGSNIIT